MPCNGGLHELASAKSFDIERAEIKPFAVFAFRLKPVVPICFDANWIVGADFVHLVGSLRKLDGQFVLAPAGGVASADFVVAAGSHEVDEANLFRIRFLFRRMLLSIIYIWAQIKNVLEVFMGSTIFRDFQHPL